MEIDKSYIDEEDALKRVGGNRELYIKLLGQFIADNHIASLEEALDSGDMETAERAAHTIKGVGANLSLPKLASAALELEMSIKNKQDTADNLTKLKEVYDATSSQIALVTG